MKWFEKFLKLYSEGKFKDAYEWKYNNIPKALYKFQPYQEDRISTILEKKLWFTIPKNFNDPFDSRGVYWNYEKLDNSLKKTISNSDIESLISNMRDNIKISCFSSELYNMPMWAHYADNHKGFCVKYDFTELDKENDLTKYLLPVGYEKTRYDITNLIEILCGSILHNKDDSRIYLLIFLMLIKNISWSNENEWRIINFRSDSNKRFEDGNEDCFLKPKAIYLGVNFDKSKINDFKSKFKGIGIPIYTCEIGNSKFFNTNLDEQT